MISIRLFRFQDWKTCWSWNVIPGQAYLIGAGQIELKIENGWEPTIQGESLVVLHKDGEFLMYERND